MLFEKDAASSNVRTLIPKLNVEVIKMNSSILKIGIAVLKISFAILLLDALIPDFGIAILENGIKSHKKYAEAN